MSVGQQITHSSISTDLDCLKLSQPGQLCKLSWMYISQSRQKNCLHFGHETQGAGMFPASTKTNHVWNTIFSLFKTTKAGFLMQHLPGFRRLNWQPKQVLGRLRGLLETDGDTSSKAVIGNKWWYDLAKWGEETRVRPHIWHSVGNSQTRALHRGQV